MQQKRHYFGMTLFDFDKERGEGAHKDKKRNYVYIKL